MSEQSSLCIVEHFGALDAPRIELSKAHLLVDVVTIAICAVICGADDWVEVAAVGRKPSRQTRYYISSLPDDAKQILKVVRGHWGIENGLHWILDIAFQADQSRLRNRYQGKAFTHSGR